MWAADHYAIEPDVIASAKALRVGATISRSEMFPTEKNRLGSTFGGGDLLGSMMGAFTLQAIDEHDLLANATRRGRQAKEILRDDAPDTVVDVRGKGLMLAVEFDTPERRSAVVEASLDRGLLTLGCGTKTIRLLPRSTRPNAKSRSARAFSSTRSTPSVRARRPPDAVVEGQSCSDRIAVSSSTCGTGCRCSRSRIVPTSTSTPCRMLRSSTSNVGVW